MRYILYKNNSGRLSCSAASANSIFPSWSMSSLHHGRNECPPDNYISRPSYLTLVNERTSTKPKTTTSFPTRILSSTDGASISYFMLSTLTFCSHVSHCNNTWGSGGGRIAYIKDVFNALGIGARPSDRSVQVRQTSERAHKCQTNNHPRFLFDNSFN